MLQFAGGVLAAMMIAIPLLFALTRRTERRARDAERRARDAERLAELGSMTGGLAHEIKNPLSTIGLNAQLLQEGLADSSLPPEERDRLARRLDSLAREARRLGEILTDFLQFAGRMNLDRQPHHIGDLVEEVVDFFLPQCRQHRVVLRNQTEPGDWTAPVDAGLLKQSLLNLMLNAVQAMSGHSPDDGAAGELLIRVEGDRDEVRIHVTDTGPGITSDQLDAIQRPYVSGRPGGTGLGLPTTRRIVEEHGGHLEIQSELGRGSDFIIHLPREETA